MQLWQDSLLQHGQHLQHLYSGTSCIHRIYYKKILFLIMAISELHRALGTKINLDSTDIPADTVITADIADGQITNQKIGNTEIQAGKIDFFQSTEQTGTGSEANVAHGLGRTPTLVIVYPTENTTGNTMNITEGTHDGTNIKVNAPATMKYKVVAF